MPELPGISAVVICRNPGDISGSKAQKNMLVSTANLIKPRREWNSDWMV